MFENFERHIVIPVEDLRFLELYCGNCGNGYLLDMDMPDEAAANVSIKCPSCDRTGPGFNAKVGPEFNAKSYFHQFRDFRKTMRAFTKAGATNAEHANFRRPQFRIATGTTAQPPAS